MKRIQPSGAQNRRRKIARESKENASRGALDAWVTKKQVVISESDDVSYTFIEDDFLNQESSVKSITAYTNNSDSSTETDVIKLKGVVESNIQDIKLCDVFCNYDIGIIKRPISLELLVSLVQQGPEKFQHKDGPFAEKDGRSLTYHWFESLSSNGERIQRKWLIYSPHRKSAFCFACVLFSKCETSFCNKDGFNKWKKLNPRILDHEKSRNHRNAMREYLDFTARIEKSRNIDSDFQEQILNEKKRWKLIIGRIVDVIFLLAKQNIAFRSHRDEGVSQLLNDDAYKTNSGNFLEIIRLLAGYDNVLFEHLQKMKNKPNKVNYLSNKSQNEIINITGDIIKKKIISEIKKAKYFTLMLDSTPDVSCEDQITQILRYVDINENKVVEIKEVFLGFFQVSEKNATSLVSKVLAKFNDDGIDINNCRGQSYDNAAVMSGIRNGVQKRILEINPQAHFINCENHNLNLAGVHAAEVHPKVITFFGVVDKIFVFFSSSTLRWEVLISKVKNSVKRHCETRWSSHYNAVKTIRENFDEIVSCLEHLGSGNFTSHTKSDAPLLLHSVQKFTFFCFLNFWFVILSSIERVTKCLQDPNVDFTQASNDLDGLVKIIELKKENTINDAVMSATVYCEKWSIPLERVRRRKKMLGEYIEEEGVSTSEEIKCIMNEIANRLVSEISDRSIRLRVLANKFSFLTKLDSFDVKSDDDMKSLKQYCQNFAENYKDDIDSLLLYEEIIDCLALFRSGRRVLPKNAKEFLFSLVELGWDVFPTLCISFRLLLTIGYSIASCERSFSKLKLIRTYLRSSMSNDRLSSLSLISIEKSFMTNEVKEAVVQRFVDGKIIIGRQGK